MMQVHSKLAVLLLSLSNFVPTDVCGSQHLKVKAPSPYQVTQRVGYLPDRSTIHEPGGPRLGYGNVEVRVQLNAVANGTIQYRTALLKNGYGQAVGWTRLTGNFEGHDFRGKARLPAGGWYRLEIRLVSGDNKVMMLSAVEPVGVGEVFLIAGQSNAAGHSDDLTRIEDPDSRVVAYDLEKREWRVANDPQPNAGPDGTIWPSMCNALLPVVQVPIGLVNLAVASTSSKQWLPGTNLYRRLVDAGKNIGLFRFVLWQQGESDVIQKVPTQEYINNMIEIRRGLERHWHFKPPWLLAKSTLHPTVYNDPVHEQKIRAAINSLWQRDGFRPGPDTDLLAGENRGDRQSRRHFSGLGQKRAGIMWFASIWHELQVITHPVRCRRE
jgi:hypothetical protein